MSITTEDVVTSVGRIKVIQGGRTRFIEFALGRVMDVGVIGITVNPVGMKALVICRPEDLEVVDEMSTEVGLPQTERSRESAREVAEQNKTEQFPDFDPSADVEPGTVVPITKASAPEGKIDITGAVNTEEQPKPKRRAKTIKDKREAEGDKPAPPKKPAARRRRR